MGWEAWFTVVVTLVMVVAMARNVAGPDFVLLGGLTLLVTTGVVPLERATIGFSNEGMLTVAALFVVAAGVRDTGGLDAILRRLLGRPKGLTSAQLLLHCMRVLDSHGCLLGGGYGGGGGGCGCYGG